jgi:hypothetical protein
MLRQRAAHIGKRIVAGKPAVTGRHGHAARRAPLNTANHVACPTRHFGCDGDAESSTAGSISVSQTAQGGKQWADG